MSLASLLLGTHAYPATGDAARRQSRALASLREVSHGSPINLQFRDRGQLVVADGCETLAVLEQDSRTVSGRNGPRKPIVSEMFTRLASLAVERGRHYFAFSNSDIVFTPDAVERIGLADRHAYVFARTETEPETGRDLAPLIYGADAFAVDARWWLDNQRRFRQYIVGESLWDNVYAAQLLCWADGILLNREPLVRHETHAIAWKDSPFVEYNGVLTALDRLYFSRWTLYTKRLETLRSKARGLADAELELRLQEEVFRGWRPGPTDLVLQALRVAKLRLRRFGQ